MFDIDLPIGSARGRRRQGAVPHYVRDLQESDLYQIHQPPEVGASAQPLRALRERHHAIARLVAEGRKGVEISAILGVSQTWLSTLKSDPAFVELVQYYASQKEAMYLDVHERLAMVGGTALAILQDRLDAEGEDMSTRELRELAEFAFDRSVAPAKGAGQAGGQTGGAPVTVQVNFVPAARQEAPLPPPVVEPPQFRAAREEAEDAQVVEGGPQAGPQAGPQGGPVFNIKLR